MAFDAAARRAGVTDRSQRPVWLGVDERGWDHVRVHLQLLQDERVTSYHLAVYLGIAAHAETSSGRAYPSAATLARYGGMGDRKVREVVKELAEWKYLRIEPRDGAASTYFLLPPPPMQEVQGSGTTAAREDAPPRHDGTRTAARGADELEGTRSKNNGHRRPPAAEAAGDAARALSDPDRRRANPCKQCGDLKLVEALGGAYVQCPRCSGSGVEPSRRVS